jgi:recombination DNA repair RAD52 pathway protein
MMFLPGPGHLSTIRTDVTNWQDMGYNRYMTTTQELRTDPRLQPLTDLQLQVLTASLNPARVSKRDGMSYLQAFDVKATLIRVFGFGGFSSELIESEILDMREVPQRSNPQKMNQKVTAKAVVRLTIHQTGAVYTEAAIAGSMQPDITEALDMALKSAESDALKRAAIFLGTQLGLSLYDSGTTLDVVRRIVAPNQIWPPAPTAEAQEEQTDVVDEGEYGTTPEQRDANQALLNRALQMKAQKDNHAEDEVRAGATS